MKKGVTVLIVLLVLFSGCAEKITEEQPTRGEMPAEQPKKCAGEGEFCGGIAGIICCEGSCQLDGTYPDAGGICVKGMAKKTVGNIVSIHSKIENNCIGFVPGAPEETEMISRIGGGWARPHPGPFAWGWIEKQKGSYDFATTDEWVKESQKNKVALLATIWPYADWDQGQCHDSTCKVTEQDIFYPKNKMGFVEGIPESRCAPCNYEDYQNFITKLVERYDGDGIDDMIGLEIPIKYWEVLNEPEMKGEDMTFFKGSQDDYVQIIKKTFDTIKIACHDCKVLHGGAAGTQQFMLDYWSNIFSNTKDFDIANIHYIRGSDVNSLNVKDYKTFLQGKSINKPIWVTEAEYNSDSEVIPSVSGALQAGASKIFFTQFKIGQFGLPEDGKYSEVYSNIAAKCK